MLFLRLILIASLIVTWEISYSCQETEGRLSVIPRRRVRNIAIPMPVNLPPVSIPLPMPVTSLQPYNFSPLNRIGPASSFSWHSFVNNIKGFFNPSTPNPLPPVVTSSLPQATLISFPNQPLSNVQMFSENVPIPQSMPKIMQGTVITNPYNNENVQFLINKDQAAQSAFLNNRLNSPSEHFQKRTYVLTAPFELPPDVLSSLLQRTSHIQDPQEKIMAIKNFLEQYKEQNSKVEDTSSATKTGSETTSFQVHLTPEMESLMNKLPDQQTKIKLLRLLQQHQLQKQQHQQQQQQQQQQSISSILPTTKAPTSIQEILQAKNAAQSNSATVPGNSDHLSQLLNKLGIRPSVKQIISGVSNSQTTTVNPIDSQATDLPSSILAKKLIISQQQQNKGIQNLRMQLLNLTQSDLNKAQSLIHFMVAHPKFIPRLMNEDIPEDIKNVLQTVQVLKFPETLLPSNDVGESAQAKEIKTDNEEKIKENGEEIRSSNSPLMKTQARELVQSQSVLNLPSIHEEKMKSNYIPDSRSFSNPSLLPLVYWLPQVAKSSEGYSSVLREGSVRPMETNEKPETASNVRSFRPSVINQPSEISEYSASPQNKYRKENDYDKKRYYKTSPVKDEERSNERKPITWMNNNEDSVVKNIYVGKSEEGVSDEDVAFGSKLISSVKYYVEHPPPTRTEYQEISYPPFNPKKRQQYERKNMRKSTRPYVHSSPTEAPTRGISRNDRPNVPLYLDENRKRQHPLEYSSEFEKMGNPRKQTLDRLKGADLKSYSHSDDEIVSYDPNLNYPPMFKISLHQQNVPPEVPISAVFKSLQLNNSHLATIVDYLRHNPSTTTTSTTTTTPPPLSYLSLLLPSTISSQNANFDSDHYLSLDSKTSSSTVRSSAFYSQTTPLERTGNNRNASGSVFPIRQPIPSKLHSAVEISKSNEKMNSLAASSNLGDWQPVTPNIITTTSYSEVALNKASSNFNPENNIPKQNSLSFNSPSQNFQSYLRKPILHASHGMDVKDLKTVSSVSKESTQVKNSPPNRKTTETLILKSVGKEPYSSDQTKPKKSDYQKQSFQEHAFGQKLTPKISKSDTEYESLPTIVDKSSSYKIHPDKVFYNYSTESTSSVDLSSSHDRVLKWRPVISDRMLTDISTSKPFSLTTSSNKMDEKELESSHNLRNFDHFLNRKTLPETSTQACSSSTENTDFMKLYTSSPADNSVSESNKLQIFTLYPKHGSQDLNENNFRHHKDSNEFLKIDLQNRKWPSVYPITMSSPSREDMRKMEKGSTQSSRRMDSIITEVNLPNSISRLSSDALTQPVTEKESSNHIEPSSTTTSNVLTSALSFLPDSGLLSSFFNNRKGIFNLYTTTAAYDSPKATASSIVKGYEPQFSQSPYSTTTKPSLLQSIMKLWAPSDSKPKVSNIGNTSKEDKDNVTLRPENSQGTAGTWESLFNSYHRNSQKQNAFNNENRTQTSSGISSNNTSTAVISESHIPGNEQTNNSDLQFSSFFNFNEPKNMISSEKSNFSSFPSVKNRTDEMKNNNSDATNAATDQTTFSAHFWPKKQNSPVRSSSSSPIRKIKLRWFGEKNLHPNTTSS